MLDLIPYLALMLLSFAAGALYEMFKPGGSYDLEWLLERAEGELAKNNLRRWTS